MFFASENWAGAHPRISEALARHAGGFAAAYGASDLDLIAVDDLVVERPDLRLPHPAMHERRFVLEPMAEVWPDWRHPVLGRTVGEMLAGLAGMV